ncbi:hypothetical protein KCU77_g23361, partial [Aureobasidium melanogenum]
MANRPPNPRLGSINPVFDPKNTEIPVTPAVDVTGRTSFFQTHKVSSPEVATPEGQNDGAGEDVLRRLSLKGHQQSTDQADVDPKAAHPSLNLSGQVISA